MGNEDQLIQGSEYKYMVPGKYIKDTESLLFSKNFEADESKSLSLFITDKDSEYSCTLDDFSVSIIIFLDRQYDYLSGLKADSKSILSESERVPCSDWSACYRRKLAGQITNYYFAFDPGKTDSEPLVSEDYILSVSPAQSLSLEDTKTKGKNACSYHRVLDGMLLQVAASGDICSEDRIKILTKWVLNLLHDWRLDNKQF
jgi:hypothetical protein